MIIFLLIIFLLGICIGSFLNVVIDRLPYGKDIFIDRSECEFCHHKLSAFDLIPLFSFILLKGKCRYCKKFIGWKYILIELLTGILFIIIAIQNFNFFSAYSIQHTVYLDLIFKLLITCSLIIIFFIDLFSGIIPDSVLAFIFLINFIFDLIFKFNILNQFLGGITSFLFFFLIFLITKKKGMGFGDVKFAFVIGFLLGIINAFLAFYLAFLTGAIISLILILCHKKKLKKDTIAFGPFLVLGTFLMLILGGTIYSFIFRLLNL